MTEAKEAAVWARVRAAKETDNPWQQWITAMDHAANTYTLLYRPVSSAEKKCLRRLYGETCTMRAQLAAMSYAEMGYIPPHRTVAQQAQTTPALLRHAWQLTRDTAAAMRKTAADTPFPYRLQQMAQTLQRHSELLFTLLQTALRYKA